MIVSNILNRKNDFKLRLIQRTLNTIIFDEIVIIYTRDENLLNEIKWNVELMKYENQLKLDENERTFYQNFSHDNWVFYIELWARVNFLNFIHKTYEYCFANTILNIIRIRQWWLNIRKNIKKFIRYCKKCQLIVKSKKIKQNMMHSSNT